MTTPSTNPGMGLERSSVARGELGCPERIPTTKDKIDSQRVSYA